MTQPNQSEPREQLHKLLLDLENKYPADSSDTREVMDYITANYTPNSTVESLNSQIAWLDGKVEEMREEVAERERVARIDELKHIREFWEQAIDRTLSDKPFNFVALQDIDNRIAELTKAKDQPDER